MDDTHETLKAVLLAMGIDVSFRSSRYQPELSIDMIKLYLGRGIDAAGRCC